MKIEVLTVSGNKFAYIEEGINDYLKRLSHTADVEMLYIKETPIIGGDEERVKKDEGVRIVQRLKDDYKKIALDLSGEEMTSEAFSVMLLRNQNNEGGKIQFVIGGPLGLSGEVLSHMNQVISFSKMTVTHQIIRLMLLEQVYRGFEIIRGSGYHK